MAEMDNHNTLTNAWLTFLCNDEDLPKNEIIQTFVNIGIAIRTLDCYPNSTGVVFFKDINQRLLDFLREVSLNGRKRVLAIAVSGSTLTKMASFGAYCKLAPLMYFPGTIQLIQR